MATGLALASTAATAYASSQQGGAGGGNVVVPPAPIDLEQTVSFGGARKGTLEPTTAIVIAAGMALAVGAYGIASRK
ncbi:hypothetical protein [Coraliomargarita parva]|uniref:hypothetical protein n=1 Tax=Coraliomargarita parva TaxID=3014050 RepID=UPI0022B354AE|nr:hypothetical protein [Coraliomargarita parva]